MTPETQNILNPDQINAAVEAAMVNWSIKHPDATQEETDTALIQIKTGVTAARCKDKFLNSKDHRAVRTQSVRETAAELDLHFVTVKGIATVDAPLVPVGDNIHRKSPIFAALMNELGVMMGYKEHKPSNLTFCFRQTKLGHAWKLDWSLAIQNPGDSLDSLVGKEYAVSRMVMNMTLSVYADAQLDDIGLSKIAHDIASAGAVDMYVKAYL